MASTEQPPRGDATRESLIATAIEVFAREGFHAASTRSIAAAAGVNQALIGYHFRNKDGLYLAVFQYIAERIAERLGPLAGAIEHGLQDADPQEGLDERREVYLPPLLEMVDAMVLLMSSEESAPWAQLIVREQLAPSDAFDLLYEGFMGRLLGLLTRLVERLDPLGALGDPRLVVLALLGQVLVFRTARAGVQRHMGWPQVGPAEVEAIRAQVHRNVSALFTQEGVIA
jgi:AcrR family transcriptional regulator